MDVHKKVLKEMFGFLLCSYKLQQCQKNCKLSMFRFPKDEERCRKWALNCSRDDLRNVPTTKLYNYELCSNHFENSQFTNRDKKNKLIGNAIPILFDVPNPLPKVTSSQPIKTKLAIAHTKSMQKHDDNKSSDLPSTSKNTDHL